MPDFFTDSPVGVRYADKVSAFPAYVLATPPRANTANAPQEKSMLQQRPYTVSLYQLQALLKARCRFNRTLMRQRGEAMGAEFKGKGVHVALGPMMCAIQHVSLIRWLTKLTGT